MRFRDTFTKPIRWEFTKDSYTFRADTFEDLVAKVSAFYEKDCNDEVMTAICKANPTQCHWEEQAPNFNKPVVELQPTMGLFWSYWKRCEKDDLVDYKINICKKCPHNIPLTNNKDKLNRKLALKKLHRIDNPDVGLCNLYNIDISIAANIKYERTDMPCWNINK